MDSSLSTDRDLVQQLLKGSETAFSRFFDEHSPRLFRFVVSRVGGDEALAEEIVQSALCKAVSALASYRGEARLFSWLCTFCRYELSAHYRREGRTHRLTRSLDESPEVCAAVDALGTAEELDAQRLLERREAAQLVRVVLDGLPPHYGDVLEWKYLGELSVQEIAARLDVGRRAAESTLARARRSFRRSFSSLLEGGGLPPLASDERAER